MDRENEIGMQALLYRPEHKSCSSYAVDMGVDFTCNEFKKGSMFGFKDAPAHQLLIFLEGSCWIDNSSFARQNFSAGQMVLVCQHSNYTGYANENLKLLVMFFDDIMVGGDKFSLCNYIPEKAAIQEYDFRPTQIHGQIQKFFGNLVYLLQSGLDCTHLHEIKHEELFIYLRWFYTKEELAYLFYEIIGRSLDFRKAIYQNYDKVTNVTELIRRLNMSRQLFFRRFREEFGMTAYQWILKHRREQIIRAIADTDVRIDDLYERFGYTSREGFHNFCKKEFGCTPKQLIKSYRQ